MKKLFITSILLASATVSFAQGSVRGKVLDKAENLSMPFVNVGVYRRGSDKMVKGAITDEKGLFYVDQLPYGDYTVKLTYIGYKTVERDFTLTADRRHENYKLLYLSDDSHALGEVTVTAQRSPVKLEVDRKTYDVTQDITNAGGAASDVLDNIPSVEVDTDGNISLRGNTSVEVWINGKASGLTSDNRAEILQQLPAESIERVEVIDNPSAKFSAEGSAGIINIVLKKDRKAGYYGSLQAGANTRGGANASGNINFNAGRFEGYLNIGYRHRSNRGGAESYQEYLGTGEYQRYRTESDRRGNNMFNRAGLTWHATDKDALSVSGMMSLGRRNNSSLTPYYYGATATGTDLRMMTRRSTGGGDMRMMYGELNYRHDFSDKHFLDFTIDFNKWKNNDGNIYQDSTVYLDNSLPVAYDYQSRPMEINNHSTEVKLDYENTISDKMKLQAGYQANFNRENSPQRSYIDNTSWDGTDQTEDREYFNRFKYDMDLHALYATASLKMGKLGIMAGLRGEYWRVRTESYDFEQEHDPQKRDPAFKKDFMQLFPSVFLSYQMTETQQLQLNYTRRLRRPWGGQLNSFKNTRDASIISFGNPQLTPEYSNSFSLNYLKTWTEHSLLLSAYYRPTTDVIQRVNYQSSADGMMYQTNMNVASSLSTGVEMVLKNKLCRILDLTTTANAYYYKLDGFTYDIDGQTVTGEGNSNFTWSARMQASLMLPYDISVQLRGRYRAREVITQGYRKANYSMDLGVRKTFLNKTLTLAVNCRDLLNSRRFETFTSSDTFTRHQKNWRSGRNVSFTLTWNFGNAKTKRDKKEGEEQQDDPSGGYNGDGEE